MVKGLIILGSTGSVGVQALDVCKAYDIKVVSLICSSNVKLMEEQIRQFKPKVAAVLDESLAEQLKIAVADTDTKVLRGQSGLLEAVVCEEADTVLTSVVGIAGLLPTMHAIRAGKRIALSNKETLVTAGALVIEEAKKFNVPVIPVDSEHSAIFQCLAGNREQDVDKLILTASGGPFRGYSRDMLKQVTLEQALKHPNWSMGSKITIDSATLMNKGLEVIEAMWLFDVPIDRIEVVVHPQSMIHSMVSYKDGSVMAQLGAPDMRIPISLALTWPERRENPFNKLSFDSLTHLTFEKPDFETFKCLKLAFDAAKAGGTMACAMNAANEIAVEYFLKRAIAFHQIASIIEIVMLQHQVNMKPTLDDIIETDRSARRMAMEAIHGGKI